MRKKGVIIPGIIPGILKPEILSDGLSLPSLFEKRLLHGTKERTVSRGPFLTGHRALVLDCVWPPVRKGHPHPPCPGPERSCPGRPPRSDCVPDPYEPYLAPIAKINSGSLCASLADGLTNTNGAAGYLFNSSLNILKRLFRTFSALHPEYTG